MKNFESFTTTDINELIKATKRNLFICLPSIHPELVDNILELKNPCNNGIFAIQVNILIDFESKTFREGYGDFESVKKLINEGFNVLQLVNNRISFIISDDTGYFLFTESRLIVPSDNNAINAVKIDPLNIVRLKKHFFNGVESINFEVELKNATIQQKKQLENSTDLLSEKSASVSDITDRKVKEISDDLDINPPLNPDYKRIVDFYSAKFQYVKLKFEGSNILHRKIMIPSKALPIMDAELKKRMETKLNLFEKGNEKNRFQPLIEFKTKIQEVREKYLTKIKTREESLLDKTKKNEFIIEIETLKNEIEIIKSKIIETLAELIDQTREALKKDLQYFLIANPKALFSNETNIWENNPSYVKREAEYLTKEIIYKIKWPKAYELIADFNLSTEYSDITFEDLKDPEFINELVEAKLIDETDQNSLAKFGIAVELSLKKQNT